MQKEAPFSHRRWHDDPSIGATVISTGNPVNWTEEDERKARERMAKNKAARQTLREQREQNQLLRA